MSPASKLCGFVLLLAIMFTAAYAVGARLGPVTVGHAPAVPGQQPMPMHMGVGASRGSP